MTCEFIVQNSIVVHPFLFYYAIFTFPLSQRHVRLAYQPAASSTFLSEQASQTNRLVSPNSIAR
jgi:hypothetical protein